MLARSAAVKTHKFVPIYTDHPSCMLSDPIIVHADISLAAVLDLLTAV